MSTPNTRIWSITSTSTYAVSFTAAMFVTGIVAVTTRTNVLSFPNRSCSTTATCSVFLQPEHSHAPFSLSIRLSCSGSLPRRLRRSPSRKTRNGSRRHPHAIGAPSTRPPETVGEIVRRIVYPLYRSSDLFSLSCLASGRWWLSFAASDECLSTSTTGNATRRTSDCGSEWFYILRRNVDSGRLSNGHFESTNQGHSVSFHVNGSQRNHSFYQPRFCIRSRKSFGWNFGGSLQRWRTVFSERLPGTLSEWFGRYCQWRHSWVRHLSQQSIATARRWYFLALRCHGSWWIRASWQRNHPRAWGKQLEWGDLSSSNWSELLR